MGTRIKQFNSTGQAPDGRLYAGDLLQMQDAWADLFNLLQNFGAASLTLGESGLQLLRYGTKEARLSGALRTDGILRGLGGLFAGTFTTAQRNAIPQGSRPYGLIILNADTNRHEWNAGTDLNPNWQSVAPSSTVTTGQLDPSVPIIPVGAVLDWPWPSASIPAWSALPYGQSVLKTDFPALSNVAGAGTGYPYANDTQHFSFPDYRGTVSAGKDDMGGTAANKLTAAISGNGAQLGALFGNEGVALTTAQIPAHNHGVTGAPGHNLTLPNHVHPTDQNADHVGTGVTFTGGGGGGQGNVGAEVDLSERQTGNPTSSPAIVGAVNAGSLGTANTGGGGTHLNVQPTIVVHKIMRVV